MSNRLARVLGACVCVVTIIGATRDADRILAAAKDAGVSRIDHLVTPLYHVQRDERAQRVKEDLSGRFPVTAAEQVPGEAKLRYGTCTPLASW